MVRALYTLEELEKEYGEVNPSEEENLQMINDIQLLCNMDTSISSSNPLPNPKPSGSGTGTLEVNPQEQSHYDSYIASSAAEEASRYRY